MRPVFVLLLAVLVAGCAAPAQQTIVLGEAGSFDAAGASKVDMLVMSTRARSPVPGTIYTGERAEHHSLYNLVVSIPPDQYRRIGNVQWPKGPKANPKTDFVTVKARDMTPADVDRWFLGVAGRKRKLLVFVHGFNNTFDSAAYRLAQIVHDSGAEAAPVLFTWPSRGDVLQYVYDRESATYSRDDLEYLLTRAALDPNVSDITVMAHSMGNWVMMEALRQMSIRHGHVFPKIKNVIMASPDLDVEVFRSELLQIAEPRPHITIFLSQDDKALALSRRLGGNIDRVGAVNPDKEPYRSKLIEFKLVAINLTHLQAEDPINHSKFAASPEIVRLIGKRLVEGQQVTGNDLTLGERISGVSVGAATGIGRSIGSVFGGTRQRYAGSSAASIERKHRESR